MVLPVATLDHVVISARDDLDRAAETYRALGFKLTERGYHSLGSMNHLAIFGTDYLELIAAPKGWDERKAVVLARGGGLSGLVIGSEDSAATYGALKTAGVSVEPPVEFTRPVRFSGGEGEARFRAVRLTEGVVPYGRVFYCHHFTRNLVWRDEWRHHPNGVVAVVRALIVARDPAAAAGLYADMFGRDSIRDIDGGKRVVLGNSTFDIVTENQLRDQFGGHVPGARGSSGLYGRSDIADGVDRKNSGRSAKCAGSERGHERSARGRSGPACAEHRY